MIQVEFDNQPEYKLSDPVLIEGILTYSGQYKCELCHKWSNTIDFSIDFNKYENKTVYKRPKCNSKSTYFHTPIVIDDSKQLTFKR